MRPVRPCLAVTAIALCLAPGALARNQNEQRLDVTLTPTLFASSEAIGDATYSTRRHRADFEVEVEDLQPGPYDLFIDGARRASITVITTPGGTQGVVEFSTAGSQLGKLPLPFDPRGRTIEIRSNATTLLEGVLPTTPNPEAPDDNASFDRLNESIRLETLDDSRARGRLRLLSNPNKARLLFQLQRLDNAPHTITANDIPIADFTPTRAGAALLRFSTDPNRNELPLDFDPADTTFRIMRARTIVLQGSTGANASIGGGASAIGEIQQRFNRTTADDNASGEARLRDRATRLDFKVEIEDLPLGEYQLHVGGAVRALIQVRPDEGDDTEGEVEFSTDRSERDKLPLDFDPRGQTVQIVRDDTVFLSMTFPDP